MEKKSIYVNGIGIVSPRKGLTAGSFPNEIDKADLGPMKCPDPGYREYIPADLIRRMGRVIKMGISAAKICLRDAGRKFPGESEQYAQPDAIITGTAWGCLEDTEKFLASMITNREELLTPTAFIQSTHNTVAGQIALLLKCHNYNFTYVHRGASFETALTDAMMQMQSGTFASVLTGATDEITQGYLDITGRMGLWRNNASSGPAVPGEGATFFLLETTSQEHSYAKLTGIHFFNTPEGNESPATMLDTFLAEHGLRHQDIGLVMVGAGGNPEHDPFYTSALNDFPAQTLVGRFKYLCGEYPTASAFAMGLASLILKSGSFPEGFLHRRQTTSPEHTDYPAFSGSSNSKILIYNHFMGINHAFILLSGI